MRGGLGACLKSGLFVSCRYSKNDPASRSSQDTPSGLTDAQYDQIIRETLARIESTVDRWLDEDVADIDAARTGGMLTLVLPNRSQLIINAQPPLHELWLAAARRLPFQVLGARHLD